MNVYDSQRMQDVLAPLGYQSVDSAEGADMVILNTCHIREKAAEKVFSDLGRVRKHKEAKLNAQVLAIHATRIEALFPEGGTTDASRAKAEIWQNWDAFLAFASVLSTEADTLAVAAGQALSISVHSARWWTNAADS